MYFRDKTDNKNQRSLLLLGGVVLGMLGLAYASVPLYRLFCQVTGFGGTPKVSEVAADEVLARSMTVRFDANVDPKLEWEFRPVQLDQETKIGESVMAYYEAKNISDKPLVGTATFNITPLKAAGYFVKLECFCFTEQLLQPGESISMPVLYYVDPAIADDWHLNDVTTLTLSYTFFEKKNPETVTALSNKGKEETNSLR